MKKLNWLNIQLGDPPTPPPPPPPPSDPPEADEDSGKGGYLK